MNKYIAKVAYTYETSKLDEQHPFPSMINSVKAFSCENIALESAENNLRKQAVKWIQDSKEFEESHHEFNISIWSIVISEEKKNLCGEKILDWLDKK